MPTLAYVIGLIIFSFVLATLFGRAARLGADQEVEPPSPADQIDKLIADQPAKEDKWIAELEHEIATQHKNLAILRGGVLTVETIRACGEAAISIAGAERVLNILYERRSAGRQTMATLTEGRM